MITESKLLKAFNEYFGVSLCSDYPGTEKFPKLAGAKDYFLNEENGQFWLWILTKTGMVGYCLENGVLKCYVSRSIHPIKIKTRYPDTELTEGEQEVLAMMQGSGKGSMVKNQAEAKKLYPNLFVMGLVYYDGFGPSIKLRS